MLRTHTLYLIIGLLFCWPQLVKAQGEGVSASELVLMDGDWQWQQEAGQRSVSLPFIDTEARRCTLDYRFCVPDSLGPDSLFLLLEGMVWQSEVLLDESYIGLIEAPFAATPLALSPNLLRLGEM
ncbi:MAG: hypothetical protein AAGM67_14685, partial [Bacteroidota bacterium]